jgi:hypothetical protein
MSQLNSQASQTSGSTAHPCIEKLNCIPDFVHRMVIPATTDEVEAPQIHIVDLVFLDLYTLATN